MPKDDNKDFINDSLASSGSQYSKYSLKDPKKIKNLNKTTLDMDA